MSMFKFIRSKWYRKHEKKVWVGLTVVIALTFGVTMQIGDMGRDSRNDRSREVFGEKIDSGEIRDIEARWRLSAVEGQFSAPLASDLMRAGLFDWSDMMVIYRGRDSGREVDRLVERLAWDVCMLTRAAKRNAVVVSDEDVREFVRALVERLHNRQNQGQHVPPSGGFDRDLYDQMLGNIRLTASQFERTVRELLTVQRLMTTIRQSVTVEEEEVWDRFVEQNRQVEGIVVPFELASYTEQAKVGDFKEIVAHFKESSLDPLQASVYEVPRRASFEYLLVDEDIVKSSVPDPTDAEILREYDASKDDKYVNPAWTASPGGTNSTNSSTSTTSTASSTSSTPSTSSTSTTSTASSTSSTSTTSTTSSTSSTSTTSTASSTSSTSTATPVPPVSRYRPLAEVRGDIVGVLRNQGYETKKNQMFENIESAMLASAPQDVSWKTLAQKHGFVWGETPTLSRDRIGEVFEKIMSNPSHPGEAAELTRTLLNYSDGVPDEDATLTGPTAEKVADFYMSTPAKVPRGYAIARVTAVEKSHLPTVLTDDLRELVERGLKKEKGRQAARVDAQALRDSVQRASTTDRQEAKLDTLAGAERDKKLRELTAAATRRTADQAHRACYETGPVKKSEKIDALKTIDPSESIEMAKALHEMEPGEIRVTETAKVICVVALLEKLAPKPDDFLTQVDSLRDQVRNQKGTAAMKAWLQTFRHESGVETILADRKTGTE